MKTIKVIDLLNKIANGEEVPKKIKYNDHIYEYVERFEKVYNYKREDGKYLEDVWMISNILNDEVEIIEDTPKEDKKIEKIKIKNTTDNGLYVCSYIEINDNTYYAQKTDIEYQFAKKINEIIKKVNGE